MKDEKASKRIIVGFVTAGLIFVMALGALIYAESQRIKRTTRRITQDTLPCIHLMGKIQSGTLLRYGLLTDYVGTNDEGQKAELNKRIESAKGDVDAAMRQYEKLIDDVPDRQLFEVMRSAQRPYGESMFPAISDFR
jgi:hypothetical protein